MSGQHRTSSLFPSCLRRSTFALFCAALLLGSVFAQQRSSFLNTRAVKAAVSQAVAAAVSINGTSTAGTLPVFADASGNLTNSVVVQQALTSGLGTGIGVNIPAGYSSTGLPVLDFELQGSNPTLRIDSFSNVGGASPNFNFVSGHGTAASPGAIKAGDNLGQFAANGWNGSAFPASSKVKVTFEASDNWTTTDNGTAMSFQTTQNGTTSRTTRLFIDNTGNVGIGGIFDVPANGGTPPAEPLTVDGIIYSMTGGLMFPDKTTQTTAAVSGVVLTSPDTSITVGGTATAPTVEANPAVVQDRVTPCPANEAINSISSTGSPTCLAVGGNAVSFPVEWPGSTVYDPDPTDPPTVPNGVLNVTNNAVGAPVPASGVPDFLEVPAAIYGVATGSDITAAITGYATGANGVGVFGWAPNSAQPGIIGVGETAGVYGYLPQTGAINATDYIIGSQTNATSGPTCTGVTTACGVYGFATKMKHATSGTTVGFGAELASASSVGIELIFDTELNSGTTTGNMIEASTNGAAPYFIVEGNGNVEISGKLTKGSGSFKIDHPLDPANKYLEHSFVESPDMMNIYNGVIVLDKRGRAVVQLPEYFEALNQDFRYQLTAIGAPGPNLFVASEIKDNKFVIAGGKPGAKVSWQVTGIRHDAYANANRIKVEEDKGDKRGTYIHPELFQKDPVLAKK